MRWGRCALSRILSPVVGAKIAHARADAVHRARARHRFDCRRGVWQSERTTHARGGAPPVPTLRRGLNLSHWFAQARSAQGYNQEHLTAHTTASDVALIRRLGFDHARLSVDPALLFTPANVEIVQRDRLQELERAIRMIIDADLAVV